MRIPPRPSALPGASEHFYAGNEIITPSLVSHPVRESCRRSASPPRMEEGRAGSLPSFLYGSIEVHLPPIKSGRKEEERSKQHLQKLHPYALTITHMAKKNLLKQGCSLIIFFQLIGQVSSYDLRLLYLPHMRIGQLKGAIERGLIFPLGLSGLH